MRVVLDTNVLLSALMTRNTPPDRLYQEWRHGRYELITCQRQLEEIRAVSRRPQLADRLKPSEVGRMINDLQRLARPADPLPEVQRSPDPFDDFLLAAVQTTGADYLVTGDKSGLLALGHHGATRILTARQFLEILQPYPPA